jgi:hypothetical protein
LTKSFFDAKYSLDPIRLTKMKYLRLVLAFAFVSIYGSPIFAQDTLPGWRPGISREEYEVLKRENIARMRAEQASKGDLGQVVDLKNGIHYFPFTGLKFAGVLSQFVEKTREEFDITHIVPIIEPATSTVRDHHGASSSVNTTSISGYLVITKSKFSAAK